MKCEDKRQWTYQKGWGKGQSRKQQCYVVKKYNYNHLKLWKWKGECKYDEDWKIAKLKKEKGL